MPRISTNKKVRRTDIDVHQNNTYELLEDILDLQNITNTDIDRFVEGFTNAAVKVNAEWKRIYPQFKEMNRKIHNEDIKQGLGVEDSTVTRFNTRVPAKRKYVIGLCVMYQLTAEKTDEILRRLEFRGLSPVDFDDCIYIYMLKNNNDYMYPERTFNRYRYMIEMKIGAVEPVVSRTRASSNQQDTLMKKLYASTDDIDKLCSYIEENKEYIGNNDARTMEMINELISEAADENRGFAHSELKNKRLHDKYYRIRGGSATITRDFIILVALHMRKNRDDIDDLLYRAGYNKLFKKDLLDLMVIYATEWLYIKAPKVFKTEDWLLEIRDELFENENEEERNKRLESEEALYESVMEIGLTNYIDGIMKKILAMPGIVAMGTVESLKEIDSFRKCLVIDD